MLPQDPTQCLVELGVRGEAVSGLRSKQEERGVKPLCLWQWRRAGGPLRQSFACLRAGFNSVKPSDFFLIFFLSFPFLI